MKLNWKRDDINDSEEAATGSGNYLSMRTCYDSSVLYFDGDEIRRSPQDGGHYVNRECAQIHHDVMIRVDELEDRLARLSRSAQKVVYSYWNNTDGVITGMYDLEQAIKAARKDQ